MSIYETLLRIGAGDLSELNTQCQKFRNYAESVCAGKVRKTQTGLSMTGEELLNIKIDHQDFDETITLRDFFKEIASRVMEEGEGFSGKRPFGNSGWEYDLQKGLVLAGAITGEVTVTEYEDGERVQELEDFNYAQYQAAINLAIEAL